MATTSRINAIGGHYGNSGNGSYTNSAADSVYAGPYSGQYFRSRLLFPPLRSQLGWGDRLVKISGMTLYLRNAESGTATVPVTAGVTTSSAWGATRYGSATANHSKSTVKYLYIFMPNAGAYIVNYTTNWYIHLSGTSARIRYNGYGSNYPPCIDVVWEYASSSGSLGGFATSANYMDEISFTVSLASSKYTHKIDWYFNDETTPYFTETLPAGQKVSTCSFFGDNPSGVILDEKTYFTNIGDSVPFSVTLTTYDESGTSLGTATYSSTLVYSDLINTCSINKESLVYGESFDIKLTVRTEKTTVINHYIDDKLCYSETLVPETTTTLSVSYPMNEVYNYFSYYKKEKPFRLETITYNEDGTEVGSQNIDLTILHKPIEKLIKINHDIIVSTNTIISNNYFDNAREIFSNSLSRLKDQLIDFLHPIGSIYISYNSTNPSELFGGTWESYSLARTLYSTTNEAAIGTTGGSFTHTLTAAEMPSHNHYVYTHADHGKTGGSTNTNWELGGGNSSSHKGGSTLSATGSGGSHVNTQPYSACYMWKRTA